MLIIGDWNAKVGSQEIFGATGKCGLGVQNEAGQKLTESCQENILVTANTLLQHHKRHSTHGHHQMVNNEIRLITFVAAEDTETLYSQQKKKKKRLGTNCGLDQELLVAKFRLKLKKVQKTTR